MLEDDLEVEKCYRRISGTKLNINWRFSTTSTKFNNYRKFFYNKHIFEKNKLFYFVGELDGFHTLVMQPKKQLPPTSPGVWS